MKHTILGAGPVGLAACHALQRAGASVHLVSRRPPSQLPHGAVHHAVDVLNSDALAAACADSAVIYQCLGAPYHRWAQQLRPLQSAAIAAARQSRSKLVSFENLYMYGAPRLAPFSEGDAFSPCSRKGSLRTAMVRELSVLHQRGLLEVAHVRASDLFGAQMRSSALGQELIGRAIDHRSPRVLGNPDAPHTWTYVADAGETLARVGQRSDAFGRTWHVPSAPPISQREVVRLLGLVLGRSLTPSCTSVTALRCVGMFRPEAREVVEMLYEFTGEFVMADAATRTALAQDHTPFDEALRATVHHWSSC